MNETSLWDLFLRGGFIMWPLLLCSIASTAIVGERLWVLRSTRIIPKHLVSDVWGWIKNHQMDAKRIRQIKFSSPLGRVIASGLINAKHGRAVMRESIQDVLNHEVHKMERFVNALGTIATITPLLGLLGSVIGMMEMFSTLMTNGAGDGSALAGGIAVALIATAMGLFIAIPSLFFYRLILRRVDDLAVYMEQETIKLVEALYDEKE